MRKESTARSYVTLVCKDREVLQLVDMACPNKTVEEKMVETRQRYQQLAFAIRERRKGYRVEVVPVTGLSGGGAKKRAKKMVAIEMPHLYQPFQQ